MCALRAKLRDLWRTLCSCKECCALEHIGFIDMYRKGFGPHVKYVIEVYSQNSNLKLFIKDMNGDDTAKKLHPQAW